MPSENRADLRMNENQGKIWFRFWLLCKMLKQVASLAGYQCTSFFFYPSQQAAVIQILVVVESYYVVHIFWIEFAGVHSALFSGDLDRSRSIFGCDFCVGGDAGLDGGDPGPSFPRAARALEGVSLDSPLFQKIQAHLKAFVLDSSFLSFSF